MGRIGVAAGVALKRWRLAGLAALAAHTGCGGAVTSSGSEGPTAVRISDDRVDGRRLLIPDSARAVARGAGPLQVVGADVAADGDRVGAFVEIPSGACVIAFSRGSQTIHDTDLFAFTDDGTAYASDESPEKGAALVLCPPHPRRLYIAGRVVSGAGVLAVGIHEVAPSRAPDVAAAVGARAGAGEESGRLDSWPGLETKLNRHRRALGSSWEDVRRVALPLDPRAPSRISLTIDEGRCLDLLVTPSDEVASLDVSVEDEDGRVLARAKNRGRDRTMVLCSSESQLVHVAVRPRSSQGLAAIVVGRSAVGAERELVEVTSIHRVTETRPLDEARRAHRAAMSKLRYEPAKLLGTGEAKVGYRHGFTVELPAGCSRLDIVAGAPGGALDVALWDTSGEKLAHEGGPVGATLYYCGDKRQARVDVEALARPSPFAVELFESLDAPEALVQHPLLASGLLSRLDDDGEPLEIRRASGAKVIDLSAARVHKVAAVVPATRCVEVVAAVGDGASGIELRWAGGTSGPTPVRRGHRNVADRFCAGDAPRTGQVEVTVAEGSAEALILSREVP